METTNTSGKAPGGIQGEKEVIKKVVEALGTDHYLILVTTLDQKTKELTHFRHKKNFPYRDITPTLKHYNEEFRKDKARGIK